MIMKTELVNKTINLYSKSGWKSIFAKLRFWYAPYKEVEDLIPVYGTVVDLGCGEGIFSNYIGLCSKNRKVIGIEIDKNRIKKANHNIPNVNFINADITKSDLPQSDIIICFQLLHHLKSYEIQEELIKKCIKNLNKGGKIIIDEIRVDYTLRYWLAWIADHFLVPLFFEKRLYSSIFFRTVPAWKKLLEKKGLNYNIIIPKGTNKPFTNVIFECRKA